VVDFGKELEHSPDGKMYIVGHGANRSAAHQSWMQGDQVYLARVDPTVEAVNNLSRWEFYAGGDRDDPLWITGEVEAAQPLFTWPNHTGVVTMTYLPALAKFVMCVSTPTFTPYTTQQFDTYFLEADSITGPFRMVSYLSEFGPQAYFVNIPSKFLPAHPTSESSLRYYEAYLSYSANFDYRHGANPPGSGYHWSLQRMRFSLA